MADQYEEKSRRWEEARTLVRSQQWKWIPDAGHDDPFKLQTPGTMQCEIASTPESKVTEHVLAAIREFSDLEPLCMRGETSDLITIPCPRLAEFEGSFGHCYEKQTMPITHSQSGANGQKAVSDYTYSLSKKGNDIYVFLPTMSEATALREALVKKDVRVSSTTIIEGQYRIAVPVSQQKKLEALGVAIQPYSRRHQEPVLRV